MKREHEVVTTLIGTLIVAVGLFVAFHFMTKSEKLGWGLTSTPYGAFGVKPS